MEFSQWFAEHWFDFVQTVGIVGGLLIAAYTTRRDEGARRIGNSIAINEQYREIWKQVFQYPELARVIAKDADITKEPVSVDEELFVTMIITHLSTIFRAWKHGEFVELEGLQKDVQGFFALPIPKIVWEKFKPVQDRKFVAFVESSLRLDPSAHK